MKAPKSKRGPKDPDAALKATPEFQTFEAGLKAVLRVPKEVVDRQMAELHPKREKKIPDS